MWNLLLFFLIRMGYLSSVVWLRNAFYINFTFENYENLVFLIGEVEDDI